MLYWNCYRFLLPWFFVTLLFLVFSAPRWSLFFYLNVDLQTIVRNNMRRFPCTFLSSFPPILPSWRTVLEITTGYWHWNSQDTYWTSALPPIPRLLCVCVYVCKCGCMCPDTVRVRGPQAQCLPITLRQGCLCCLLLKYLETYQRFSCLCLPPGTNTAAEYVHLMHLTSTCSGELSHFRLHQRTFLFCWVTTHAMTAKIQAFCPWRKSWMLHLAVCE